MEFYFPGLKIYPNSVIEGTQENKRMKDKSNYHYTIG